MFTGQGQKLFGEGFRNYMIGTGDLFHVPDRRTLNDVIREETGIEDDTSPGSLPHMISAAKDAFGSRPVILTHDERSVITF